jgi:DNA-binding CsgD family transcriptional regulator
MAMKWKCSTLDLELMFYYTLSPYLATFGLSGYLNIFLTGYSGSMKSFLKALVPSYLHRFFFREDDEGQDKTRHYDMDLSRVHFVEPGDFPRLVNLNTPKIRDQKYMSYWLSLTFREQEVLALACMGHRNYQIGQVLHIEDGTIKSHWQHIFKKFNMRNRQDIRLALRDWDFYEWWENRHRKPTPLPDVHTGG